MSNTITISKAIQMAEITVQLPYHVKFRDIYVRITDENSGLAVKDWSVDSEISIIQRIAINVYLGNPQFTPTTEDEFMAAYGRVTEKISKYLPAL